MSDPTWANHTGLFEAAGLTVKTYPYYDYDNHNLKFEQMLDCLNHVKANDIVLLHACCHNPSGMDLTNEQWDIIANVANQRGFTPLIDMAYQGFGDGIDEDAYGVRLMASNVDNMILCCSCSKNFGLYRERIGACSLIGATSQQADTALSILLYVIRCNYSMPPAHGAAIVETILDDVALKQQWHDEVKVMRDRINGNRRLLTQALTRQNISRDFNFITEQKGMFSFLGLSTDQVQQLKSEFSIYMVDSSRISIAGISDENVEYIAKAVAMVL